MRQKAQTKAMTKTKTKDKTQKTKYNNQDKTRQDAIEIQMKIKKANVKMR